jgi:hypothetical protein
LSATKRVGVASSEPSTSTVSSSDLRERLRVGAGGLDREALEAQAHRDDVDDVRLVVDDEHAVGVRALAHAATIVAEAVSFLGAGCKGAAKVASAP